MPMQDYLKRIYYWYFDREKIEQSLKTRKGKCHQCGRCCYIFGVRCPFLDKKNHCLIYKFRPNILCKIPPLNLTPGEIKKHREFKCGYYWVKKQRG